KERTGSLCEHRSADWIEVSQHPVDSVRQKQSLRGSGGWRKPNGMLVLGCFGCLGGFGLASVGLGVLAAETLDASGGVHQLLLAGEERMAGGADFHADVALV